MKKLLILLLVLGMGMTAWLLPHDEALHDALQSSPQEVAEESQALLLTAMRQPGPASLPERWALTYPRLLPASVRLTLELPPPRAASTVSVLDSRPGMGALTVAPGAQPAAFLAQLADVMGGRPSSATGPMTSRLEVGIVALGDHLSRGPGVEGTTVIAGEFAAEPAGDWRAMRLSMAGGRAECFLAVSEVEATALLLPKALEHGPLIVAEFARLLGGPVPAPPSAP